MSRTWKRRIAVALLMFAPLTATTLEMGCVETALVAANPCGTILNCDPTIWYELIWPVITAPDYERDPTCTIPGGCGPWFGDQTTFLGTT